MNKNPIEIFDEINFDFQFWKIKVLFNENNRNMKLHEIYANEKEIIFLNGVLVSVKEVNLIKLNKQIDLINNISQINLYNYLISNWFELKEKIKTKLIEKDISTYLYQFQRVLDILMIYNSIILLSSKYGNN